MTFLFGKFSSLNFDTQRPSAPFPQNAASRAQSAGFADCTENAQKNAGILHGGLAVVVVVCVQLCSGGVCVYSCAVVVCVYSCAVVVVCVYSCTVVVCVCVQLCSGGGVCVCTAVQWW